MCFPRTRNECGVSLWEVIKYKETRAISSVGSWSVHLLPTPWFLVIIYTHLLRPFKGTVKYCQLSM